MEETISINDILQVLKKRISLIIIILISAIILCAIFTFFIATPQYQANTQILVNQTQNNEQSISASELQSNRELIDTYNVIITSPIILDEVLSEMNLNRSANDLQSQISVAAEEESQVLNLTIEDTNPETANNLANVTAQIFEREVPSIMNIDNVSVLSESQLSDTLSPVSPNPPLNFLIASLIGLIFGVSLAFFLEFIDQTVKTESDVEKVLKLPVLGSVSIIDSSLSNDKFEDKQTRSNKSNDINNKSKKTS